MEISGLNNINVSTTNNVNTNPNTAQSPSHTHVSKNTPNNSPARERVQKEASVQLGDHQTGSSVRSHVQDAKNEELEKEIKALIDSINSKMKTNTEISFSIHEKSSKLNIKIIDKESKKVLQEWPSEQSLDMLAKIFEKQAVLLDKKL